MLDSSFFSRKYLVEKNMLYIGSALNASTEPADYDSICFGIDDVDSLAIQNADLRYPPIRIFIDFRKFLQLKTFMPGQVFVKEHDLLWSSKPDSQEVRKTDSLAKDHKVFAAFDIPDEFSDGIKIGKINLKIYRNACGIKFMIDEKKYVLHYTYNGKYLEPYQQSPTEEEQLFFNIQEDVIEADYGQTIFYGQPGNVEKFFVMQFFRHLEKLPKLMDLICQELNQVRDEEMISIFNLIGKKLSAGAEFNFQRAVNIPIEAITEIHFISNFNISEKNKNFYAKYYSCNLIFSIPEIQTKSIKILDLIDCVQNDKMIELQEIEATFKPLFKSYKLVEYLLNFSIEGSDTHQYLLTKFTEILSFEERNRLLDREPVSNIADRIGLIMGNRTNC
nr:hypothetical protein [Legionella jordanis]